jgi:hypothetical protein
MAQHLVAPATVADFVNGLVKAGEDEDARMLLERVAGRHPVPPERRIGYAEAARRVAH